MGEDAQKLIILIEIKFLSVKGTCQFKFQSLIDAIIDRTHVFY
jgi:hypothetical protein